MHGLNNATQLLSALNALAGRDDDDGWLEKRSADLARTSREIEDLGYVLAVLAAASGADLFGERREPRGLELVLDALASALRLTGAGLAPAPPSLPRLTTPVGEGWELPWAVGTLLWASATDLPPDAILPWSLERRPQGWILTATCPAGPSLAAAAGRVHARLAGAGLESRTDGWSLSLPAAWLRPGEGLAPPVEVS
jgi:hypothetical protein